MPRRDSGCPTQLLARPLQLDRTRNISSERHGKTSSTIETRKSLRVGHDRDAATARKGQSSMANMTTSHQK
eukprot:2505094-Amphidinium_carterae.1